MLEKGQLTRIMAITTLFASLLLVPYSVALALPKHTPVPGGVALVPLESSVTPETPVFYQSRRVLVTEQNNQLVALIGIPLNTAPGSATLHLQQPDGPSLSFDIHAKSYAEQRIKLDNKRQVNPYKKDMDRIIREKKLIKSKFTNWRTDAPDLTFTAPVEGVLSSPFGLRRFFNDQPRSPHSGIDIAAAEGTPLLSPASGVISGTGDFFFNGKTVFIDHGQGLVSMLCHLQEILVNEGDPVNKGQMVGKVGMTGRVTGPHVHWGLSLNNARVDPTLFYTP